MRHRTIQIDCSRSSAEVLAETIRAYAEAAYPPGGSDCAQATRESLLGIADGIDLQHHGVVSVKKRLLPTVRAALRWRFSEDDSSGGMLPGDLEPLLTHRQ